MAATGVRIVQLSDTHLRAAAEVPPEWSATRDWLNADPPDLVVHTGDIVVEDPDDEADRAFARRLMDELDAPFLAVPGNHDVGFFDEPDRRDDRIVAFRATWGADRFVLDLGGWRIVGANTYLFGVDDDDRWLGAAVAGETPTVLFTHQPLADEPLDGWEVPAPALQACAQSLLGADVRVVATGHRHRHRADGRAVWCPSLTIRGDEWADGGATNPATGLVEHRLDGDGTSHHRVVRPWAVTSGSRRGG